MKKLICLALVGILPLAGCASTSQPRVSSFDRADELGGIARGTFTVDGESFISGQAVSQRPFNDAVSNELTRLGFSPAAGGDTLYVAQVNVSQGRMTGPSGASVGIGGGSYGGNVGLGGGISLPIGSRTDTMTEMTVRLVRRSDDLVVWEGRTQQDLRGDVDQPALAARLAAALFANFPGN